MMGEQWKFLVDGYAAETSDPYLAELIHYLLDKIKSDSRVIKAFIVLVEQSVNEKKAGDV